MTTSHPAAVISSSDSDNIGGGESGSTLDTTVAAIDLASTLPETSTTDAGSSDEDNNINNSNDLDSSDSTSTDGNPQPLFLQQQQQQQQHPEQEPPSELNSPTRDHRDSGPANESSPAAALDVVLDCDHTSFNQTEKHDHDAAVPVLNSAQDTNEILQFSESQISHDASSATRDATGSDFITVDSTAGDAIDNLASPVATTDTTNPSTTVTANPDDQLSFTSTSPLPSPNRTIALREAGEKPSETIEDTVDNDQNETANPQRGLRLSRSTSRLRPDNFNFNTTSERPVSPSEFDTPTATLRKTSPGLAARLKALGFGTSKKNSAPAQPESIGRLNEQQLRELDEKHQAGSVSAVISRRGRPWKGAGSFPSLRKSVSHPDLSMSPVSAATPRLPEIEAPEPLAMDVQKYRLPEHTNSNGTKATLQTRREHLIRNARPPSPPPPPAKDVPPIFSSQLEALPSGDFVPGLSSYFTPGHGRPGSIYTLSRASFANQLAQLTSLQLPDAENLSSKVSAIPTAQSAARALINAAEQIRSWISKAQEVIGGLDSEDDVEWAAAGGREGLDEVENAITRFEHLINAYVGAIEELQRRKDVAHVSMDELRRAVGQMEAIVQEWSKIKWTLQNVRGQVEIAMEWEELWNNVLGDIQNEMDELSRLVFEMEERRHKSLAVVTSGDGLDIGDLETIVEDTPQSASRLQASNNQFSLPAIPLSPSSPGTSALAQDDSNLLALFARMQPLRASLDFLPMRLSVFENRAKPSFPTACEELEMRREGLDASYKKLEKDAESLRKELGEDRWVLVFHGAGRQAQKMHESVERSLLKLREAVDSGMHLTSQSTISKKIENYEAKKTHYGPAIERVLSIIDRGVKDRLTVNGEILRHHHEMQARWASLKAQIAEMDIVLEDIHTDRRGLQLRDSVSSMLSIDQSTVASGRDTPGSSPPSSVIMSNLGFEPLTPAPKQNHRSPNASLAPPSSNRRHSSLPAPIGAIGRKSAPRLSAIAHSSYHSPAASGPLLRPGSNLGHRPRWNGSTSVMEVDSAHSFASPSSNVYTSSIPRSTSSMSPGGTSKLPTLRHAFSRATSESPKANETSPRTGGSRLSFRDRIASPGPYSQFNLHKSLSSSSSRRATIHPTPGADSRPGSAMGSLKRGSLMPSAPKGKKEASRGASPLPGFSRFSTRKNSNSQLPEVKELKPRWRF